MASHANMQRPTTLEGKSSGIGAGGNPRQGPAFAAPSAGQALRSPHLASYPPQEEARQGERFNLGALPPLLHTPSQEAPTIRPSKDIFVLPLSSLLLPWQIVKGRDIIIIINYCYYYHYSYYYQYHH